MTSFLKKLQLLKRKSLDSDESLLEQKRNHREVPNPTHQPSGSHDPASQRTTQLLPLLIKPTPSPTPEAKKKPPPPPLVLPELVQQQPSKASVASSKPEERQKEATVLPKLPAKVLKSSSSTGKKKQPGTLEETAPLSELSDENFRYIWDSKILPRGKSVREVVEMLDEREVLDTILSHLQQMVQAPAVEPKQTGRKRLDMATAVDSDHKSAAAGPLKLSKTPSKEKTSLYRYYGLKLRDTTHKEVVSEYLHMLLGFSTQDEADQEGISEAISLAASSHLREILMALRDYGNMMGARRSLLLEKTSEDAKSNTAVRVRTTLILCYGHAAVGAKPEDMLMQAELIVSELLYQFRGDPKDETLKKTFMKSVVMISKAFQDIHKEDILFPHKSELVICIIEVIDEEPVGSFSFAVLHQALTTICCMTSLKPPLDYEVKYDLVRKSVKKVFSLPSLKMTKLKAGSPTHPTLTQDFYLQTIQACNVMLTSLLSETPNMEGLQEILIHTNGWIESEKTYERERAVKSTSHVLKFVSEHLDFDVSQEFSLLGQLVALLALRTVDNVKEIGLQAAEAMYHLHYITMSRMVKELEKKHKNKKGNVVKWFREDFFIPGPAVFYNNIAKVAKAFGEHLGTNHITDLVLKVIDHLVHEEKTISRAAAVLLSSFLDECGMDVEDLPMIVKEIYNHLSAIRDSETKEETIKAVCNLASKRLNRVVDSLLESSVDCDNNAMELWKALVADPYANVKLMKPLLKWLQDEEPLLEGSCRRNSKTHMPMAATNALCWILSLPEASEVVQGKFPQLLLALVTQIYYTFGTSRRASKRSNASDCPDPRSAMSSAVQALKNLISCIGFIKEYNILGVQGCWEKLQHPDSYFEGVFNLVRILFMFSKVHLKMTFKQANTYLRHMEIKERTVGMAFFTELLVFSEIGLLFVKQDILDVLRDWMMQPCPLMQVFSIRGLGHLLQHPVEDESLEGILPPLMSCAFDPDRNIAKESIKTLQYLFRHLEVEEYGSMGISLISHLLKYFNDEDNHLRNDSIVLFGTLLKGAGATDSNRHSVKEDVFLSQVPLLIQLADPFTKEVSKDVLITCTNFMKWGDIPKEVFEIENYTSLHYLYFNICKHLMRKYRNRLPEMLNQTVHYLKSKFASYREAAATLIGNYAPYMTSDVVSTKDTEDTYLAVRELQGDCETSVSNATISAIEQLFQYCGNRISHHLIPHQLIPVLRSSLEKAKLEERK